MILSRAMEFQSDESTSYLNKSTGKVLTISEEEFTAARDDEPIEDFPDWQYENITTAKEILETEDYIPLPTKFDIHEYDIMEKFCLSRKDEQLRNTMYSSIKGSGAFRRFKNNIRRYNIEDDWYTYRDAAMKEIGIEWCKYNNIALTNE